ncbi:MAG: efflux RND transporter periplasmic adaptor subunit [Thiovulaceae bacterium]|nr:efflux RND transporter periplasmic adaptor subunit [Sulfurimonadaceae bacterium]
MNKIFFLTLSFVASLYASGQESHVQVSVVTPMNSDMNIQIDVQATSEATSSYIVNTPFDGVLHTRVLNTQKVKKGQVIATIENTQMSNNKETAKYNLLVEKKQLEVEAKKLQVSHEMLKLGVISSNDYLSQESMLNEKKIALSNAKSEFVNVDELIKKSVITAPVSGYISQLQADGSYLTYASPICKIENENVHIKLFVPLYYVKNLKIGQNVTLHVSGNIIQAKISQILSTTTNNLVDVIATTKATLQTGVNLEASIQMQSQSGWIIPKDSIVLVQNRPAIYIIKDHIAHLHFVDVQKDMINKVLIVNHLNKDDKIAFENSYMLEEGTVVEVIK